MLLIRHGQSVWNAEGRWQGQADPPLSELGRRQAAEAARRLGSVDLLVASDLERAVHTAQILSSTLGVGPVVIEPALRETDAGEWSGLTKAEIERAWPGYLAEHRRPPGFEDPAQLLQRVLGALDALHRAYAGAEIAVVTHGGVIYAVEGHLGAPFARISNLGARAVVHRGDRLVLGDRVELADPDDTTVPTQL